MRVTVVQILALVTLLQLTTIIIGAVDSAVWDDSFAADDNAICPGEDGATYDYIVVGGGSSGSVVATRLSQNSSNSVLLLDGGGRSQSSVGGTDFIADRYTINGQGDAVFKRPLTRYDVPAFCYSTVPDYPDSPCPPYPLQTSYAGIVNTSSRIFGGNSVHNYMVWDRATPSSINAWNVSGWTYADCLPFFKKSEDVTGLGFDPAYHGFSGPIELNFAQAKDPAGDVFIKSCVNAGFPFVSDFNDPNNYIGCGQPVFNINDRGIRASSLNEYLAPAQGRPNLKIRVNSFAIKILFSTSTPPKAIGVRYVRNGITYTARANKEIIISAGASQTPHLLLLSGVGPAAHLNSLNIPVVSNLPVGKRMAIHPVTFARFEYNVTNRSPYSINADSVEYATKGTGLYASTATFAEAKLKSKPTNPDMDINILVDLTTPGIVEFASLLWGSKQDNGTITLTSNDWRDFPLFTYSPYANQDDLDATVQTLKYFRRIARNYPANETFGREVVPGPQYSTDAQLRAYVLAGGGIPTITHLHGGAVMGNYGDTKAVLDPRLRVKGVTGLRVADLSIVPGVILGGPMANGVMFGERAAAFILADNA